MITHTHYCKHCNSTWFCHDCDTPNQVYTYTKTTRQTITQSVDNHDCGEREMYGKRMQRLLSGSSVACKYGCGVPCNHPTAQDDSEPKSNKYANEFVRPRIVEVPHDYFDRYDDTAKVKPLPVVLCDANAYSREKYYLTLKLAKVEAENQRLRDAKVRMANT